MRLPMKPSQLPASTQTFPMRRDSSEEVAMVSLAVLAPRTSSRSRMTFAGLKKCVPITASGRDVAEAIWSMSRVEVFEASTAPGLAILSRAAKTSFFTPISSKTASITMSASRIAPRSSVPVMSPIRLSMSAWESRPFSTVPA